MFDEESWKTCLCIGAVKLWLHLLCWNITSKRNCRHHLLECLFRCSFVDIKDTSLYFSGPSWNDSRGSRTEGKGGYSSVYARLKFCGFCPKNNHRWDLVAYLEETAVLAQLSQEMRFNQLLCSLILTITLVQSTQSWFRSTHYFFHSQSCPWQGTIKSLSGIGTDQGTMVEHGTGNVKQW